MRDLDLADFYSDKKRLSYNPVRFQVLQRKGLKSLVAFDGRFCRVSSLLNGIISESKKRELKMLDMVLEMLYMKV